MKNGIKHFKTITKHKWMVFCLSIKAGIPWRGFIHDLSKYSPTEFIESAHYYQGNRSPITFAKREKGYSEAWLHHKGRNKHHPDYWYDPEAPQPTPIMPYVYVVEMICDTLAAGMVYNKENWNNHTQLDYWNAHERGKKMMHPKIEQILEEVYTQVSKQGIDKTITKKNLKQIYYHFVKGNKLTKL